MNDVTEVDDVNTIHPESPPEGHTIGKVLLSQSKDEELNAKLNELEQWKSKGVYTEIEDKGQECISLCWVIKSKLIDSKPGTKTRLCAQGFEEKQSFHTNSPMCSREGIHTMFFLIVSRKGKFSLLMLKPHSWKEMS